MEELRKRIQKIISPYNQTEEFLERGLQMNFTILDSYTFGLSYQIKIINLNTNLAVLRVTLCEYEEKDLEGQVEEQICKLLQVMRESNYLNGDNHQVLVE